MLLVTAKLRACSLHRNNDQQMPRSARERAVTGDVQGLKFPAMQISTDAAKISAGE